jgi:hypothetical protein
MFHVEHWVMGWSSSCLENDSLDLPPMKRRKGKVFHVEHFGEQQPWIQVG